MGAKEERSAVNAWFSGHGLSVDWLFRRWAKKQDYDGVVFVPGIGTVRLGVGHQGKKCEIAVYVSDYLKNGKDVVVKYRCARVTGGVQKAWMKGSPDVEMQMPGECGCRGCKLREYVELHST